MEHTNWLPSSKSLQLWSTQTDYQVQHLHNYGEHKLITKCNIFRTMEHKLITKFNIFRTMEYINWLPSSTSLELWSTQTDYQAQHLQNYGAHKLITKFIIFRTMEHINWLPSSTSSELWNTQTDYQVHHLHNYGTQTDYQVQHLHNYGEHKLFTKCNIFRTMEHTIWLPSSSSSEQWSTQTDYQV
jgi:hypothetical protein